MLVIKRVLTMPTDLWVVEVGVQLVSPAAVDKSRAQEIDNDAEFRVVRLP
jgi:hypothetical protein